MKDINAINEEGGDLELVTAEELRDMTITKEEMYARDKANIIQSFMSSMVSNANSNGVFVYSANLSPAFDPILLEDIKSEFTNIGYEVEVEEAETKSMGKVKVIHFSWEKK